MSNSDQMCKEQEAGVKAIKELVDHLTPLHVNKEGVSNAFLEKIVSCCPSIVKSTFSGVFTKNEWHLPSLY